MRTAVLLFAIVFIGVFGFLTLFVLFSRGFDVLVVLSLLVLALLTAGVLGALRLPPEDR